MIGPRRSAKGIRGREWAFVVGLLLVAWGLRLCLLEEVPPGWRDDELINIHALSRQLLDGRFPVYYLGASGHEPLYHHLHAGVHAVLGFNVLSGHILSAVFGLLSVVLTYLLVRRLFPGQPTMALVAATGLAMSFWSLMYSRTAIRHISLLPLALGALYVFWRQIDGPGMRIRGWVVTGVLLGVTLYTYTASRLVPVVLLAFVAYLALVHRDLFLMHWRGMATALVVMAVVAAPLFVAIAAGRSRNAIEGIGADARVTELAGPLRELESGNPRPLLENTWTTLGMFHATGDPEWLYNIPGRPVFNLLGGLLVWAGVGLCMYRWREPRYFFLLAWLGLGLSPGFVSTPAASLGHTILAQPLAYVLPALALMGTLPRSKRASGGGHVVRAGSFVLVAFLVASNGVRDLRDYFRAWPEREMTRVLYRAEYRDIADYLAARPQIGDIAVASTLLGPWDRLALEVDVEGGDVKPRLFDPGRALVWASGSQPRAAILTSWPPAGSFVSETLRLHSIGTKRITSGIVLHELSPLGAGKGAVGGSQFPVLSGASEGQRPRAFGNGLALTGAAWLDPEALSPGKESQLVTAWVLTEPLDLPPVPVVANPPPPGTSAGSRLAVFAHLVACGGGLDNVGPELPLLAVDDGLWVDPVTLEPGDRFIQVHRFLVPEEQGTGCYAVELGLYDPMTGDRWPVLDSDGRPVSDRLLLLDGVLSVAVPG